MFYDNSIGYVLKLEPQTEDPVSLQRTSDTKSMKTKKKTFSKDFKKVYGDRYIHAGGGLD